MHTVINTSELLGRISDTINGLLQDVHRVLHTESADVSEEGEELRPYEPNSDSAENAIARQGAAVLQRNSLSVPEVQSPLTSLDSQDSQTEEMDGLSDINQSSIVSTAPASAACPLNSGVASRRATEAVSPLTSAKLPTKALENSEQISQNLADSPAPANKHALNTRVTDKPLMEKPADSRAPQLSPSANTSERPEERRHEKPKIAAEPAAPANVSSVNKRQNNNQPAVFENNPSAALKPHPSSTTNKVKGRASSAVAAVNNAPAKGHIRLLRSQSPQATLPDSQVEADVPDAAEQSHSSYGSRPVRAQGQRITRTIDPVLERAYHLTEQSVHNQAPADSQHELPQAQVQNTFNVSVAMDSGQASNAQELQSVLLEMLRTAARRQGLEV